MKSSQGKSFRIRIIFCVLLVLFIYSGCCNKYSEVKSTPVVVIQGSDLRSDKLPLPLCATDKGSLKKYLRKGGDKARSERDWVGFYDEAFYSGLLDLLSGDDKVEMNDLFDEKPNGDYKLKDSVKKWFKEPAIYGIIDSREKRPAVKSYRPFSLYDGHYFWVFYRSKDKMTWIIKVLITVPLEGRIIQYKED